MLHRSALRLLLVSAILLFTVSTYAQKISWSSGEDFAFIQGISKLNVEYDFSQMTVAEGTESAFLEERKTEINKDKPGEGDEFVTTWNQAKITKYPKHLKRPSTKNLKRVMFKSAVVQMPNTPS
ncbi:MAG: hypothetical protein HWD58_03100 [Bacteroidota bacterium]|nr:MAG: hypothetical protein HWD58_03100 [Bacteroidota bacterium]